MRILFSEIHTDADGFVDYNFLTLDGSVKQNDRMPLIDQFQNDPNVFIFLISTLAGGTGLNLTSANRVVIFDPNWSTLFPLNIYSLY